MARLCLSLTENTIEENLRVLEENRKYVDLCELRTDFLPEQEFRLLSSFPAAAEMPVIFTLRGEEAGGHFTGNDNDFTEITLSALRGNYRYVDIDNRVHAPEVEDVCRKKNISVIRSSHHFSGIPEDAGEILKNLPKHPGEIPKIACMVNGTGELFRLAALGRESVHRKQIIIGMGTCGVPSRLLPEHFRSILSYSTAGRRPAAPGHITPAEMVETYRFRETGKQTEVFGIIGNPVLHSGSPAIHNPGFRRGGIDAVYVPFPTDAPGPFLRHARALPGGGFSVTAPYKEQVAEMLELKDAAVEAIGSCNTIVWREDAGCWKGYNTDAAGFYAPLADYMKRRDPGKKNIEKATVIGAGGAARAVVYALVQAGIRVCVINRTVSRAAELAGNYGMAFGGMDPEGLAAARQHADLIVQTTKAGMEPEAGKDPWPELTFTGTETVYDIIYAPLYTAFLSRALKSGCDIITGDRMLQAQGEEQFFLFTQKPLNI